VQTSITTVVTGRQAMLAFFLQLQVRQPGEKTQGKQQEPDPIVIIAKHAHELKMPLCSIKKDPTAGQYQVIPVDDDWFEP